MPGCLCQNWSFPGHRQYSQACAGCCKQHWIKVGHYYVPSPGASPLLAQIVDAPVTAQPSSEFWAASTYNLNMQSTNQRQPWWDSSYLSLRYICVAPTWRLQPTLSWRAQPRPSRTFRKLLTLHTKFLISTLNALISLFSYSEGEVKKSTEEAEHKQAIQLISPPRWRHALEWQMRFLDIRLIKWLLMFLLSWE